MGKTKQIPTLQLFRRAGLENIEVEADEFTIITTESNHVFNLRLTNTQIPRDYLVEPDCELRCGDILVYNPRTRKCLSDKRRMRMIKAGNIKFKAKTYRFLTDGGVVEK